MKHLALILSVLSLCIVAFATDETKAVIKIKSGPDANKLTESFIFGSGGTSISNVFSAQANLDFPETNPSEFSELTMSVSGALPGDVVCLGLPTGAMSSECNVFYTAWVSDTDTVTIRFSVCCPPQNPPPGYFRVCVIHFD